MAEMGQVPARRPLPPARFGQGSLSSKPRPARPPRPTTPPEEEKKPGPSFFDQARLLFPSVPAELLQVFAAAWETYGDSNLALAAMRQDPRYDAIFPGNKRPDGSIRLTESDYLATIEGYKRRLGQFGVPVDSILSADKQRQLIEGEVSADEFGERLNFTFTQLVSNIEPVRQFFAQNFGTELSDSAFFASALNPAMSPLQFQRQIETSQIGGEASMRGFNLQLQEAQRLETLGLDQMAARRLFGQAQEQLPKLGELVQRFNDPNDQLSLEDFTNAVVISDPDQLQRFRRLFGQATSAFSPLARPGGDRGGALSGLLQQ